ncbi:TIGR03759 family integrating conjugative element protein, partial [Klebsiella pneumoniae]|nr:TIGR03759 family integrating conjugative element protein [Klebsiella pneumoniae]
RWAMAHGIDAKLVSEHSITLNHDAGRWLLLGQSKIPVALERKGEQWREVQP